MLPAISPLVTDATMFGTELASLRMSWGVGGTEDALGQCQALRMCWGSGGH